MTFNEDCLILEMLVPGKTDLIHLNLVFIKNDILIHQYTLSLKEMIDVNCVSS